MEDTLFSFFLFFSLIRNAKFINNFVTSRCSFTSRRFDTRIVGAVISERFTLTQYTSYITNRGYRHVNIIRTLHTYNTVFT